MFMTVFTPITEENFKAMLDEHSITLEQIKVAHKYLQENNLNGFYSLSFSIVYSYSGSFSTGHCFETEPYNLQRAISFSQDGRIYYEEAESGEEDLETRQCEITDFIKPLLMSVVLAPDDTPDSLLVCIEESD